MDVVGDNLLLDMFNEGTFDGDNFPAVVGDFLKQVEGLAIEIGVEAGEKSMHCVRFEPKKTSFKIVLNNVVYKCLDAVCEDWVTVTTRPNSTYFA